MSEPRPAILISTAILSFARAETVVIRDAETGKTVAEVDIDAKDSKFRHAGSVLTIQRKAPLMELRARKGRLPKVTFKEASLDDVAYYLRRPSAFVCDEEPRPDVINFVIIDQAKRNLRINIHLEEVSLYNLLTSLAKKYGLVVAYDDHAITVTDPKPSG